MEIDTGDYIYNCSWFDWICDDLLGHVYDSNNIGGKMKVKMKVKWLACININNLRVKVSEVITTCVFYSVKRDKWMVEIGLRNKNNYTVDMEFETKQKALDWVKYVFE